MVRAQNSFFNILSLQRKNLPNNVLAAVLQIFVTRDACPIMQTIEKLDWKKEIEFFLHSHDQRTAPLTGKCYMEQSCNLTSRLKREIEIFLHPNDPKKGPLPGQLHCRAILLKDSNRRIALLKRENCFLIPFIRDCSSALQNMLQGKRGRKTADLIMWLSTKKAAQHSPPLCGHNSCTYGWHFRSLLFWNLWMLLSTSLWHDLRNISWSDTNRSPFSLSHN